ncbi:MAG: hypothetical protein GTO45_03270 [Candidatus Aminicenantes bacterium]|nr:hypothetical protein [Candidatus Aminicenantes bacterium]NIM77747.1 hypothetical protein [Candidatus Aminicenantes bacterium]NIN17060.1 hypothetical protein [Candidatus Aminicenantes bacterium]NIN40953.1 hypothetical protein [Candidatus Aminicenantes bacterium]NIN83758.1 hypothetical protein [Candidatus Aminicenantes bacterium]
MEDSSFTLTLLIFSVAVCVLFAWVFKVILDWRKSKYKSDLQHKLVEKFGNVQDLKTFLETEGGSKFLNALTINGQLLRQKILSYITRGVILVFLGAAFFVIGGSFIEEQRFFTLGGIITGALGLGFLVSTAISYLLSKKWGIINKE